MIKKLFTFIFPNIENLSKKDSPLSTKRYSDLRLINHIIWQSWAALGYFMYAGLEHEITLHVVFLSALCFGRGLIAKEGFLNLYGRRNNNNDDK